MHAATKALLPLAALAIIAGCKENGADDQNVVITNEVPANADVEALPADESSGTPTNELVNGADDPDVPTADNQTDSY